MDFRAGDVLTISCPFVETTVMRVSEWHVTVRWPWWQVDPDVRWARWDGNAALARDPESSDWANELFRTEPSAGVLVAGQRCGVGIPPTVVHVIDVVSFDPPLETGMLPRPRRLLNLLHKGVSVDLDSDDQGCSIDPDGDIPLSIELFFRPYAFLNLGDDLVDAAGRAWRFDGPWIWHPYDGLGGVPAWPLTLLHRVGLELLPEHRVEIAAATATGSHSNKIDQWSICAEAAPPVP
ncbi:hypothetical protein ACQP2P_13180 [Dactylosporangium sp. CA-139114]|uniref:hypothetical protein n=1 Tax=Dactylosporangium sp. CA-139114 TaxID=3239931 RepID=UPI003D955289